VNLTSDVSTTPSNPSYVLERQSRRQLHRRNISIVIIFGIFAAVIGTAQGFSAKLTPPWNISPSSSSLLTLKPKKSNKQQTSASSSSSESSEESSNIGSNSNNPSNKSEREEFLDSKRKQETAALYHDTVANEGMSSPIGISSKGLNGNSHNSQQTLNNHHNHHDGRPLLATPNTSPTSSKTMTIKSSLPTFFRLSRPSNFPATVFFHALGVHLALQSLPMPRPSLIQALFHPSLLLSMFAILLVTSSSMIVNDYYDAKSGTDALNNSSAAHYHPISNGRVPLPLAKSFLVYMYTVLLFTTAFLPGIATRVSVIMASLLTFWYTQHLKPKTWIKNLSCAGLIALCPLTSASATSHVFSSRLNLGVLIPTLGRLILTLFTGILSREIFMDISDYEGDKLANIATIPVQYGRRFASYFSTAVVSLMSAIVLIKPMVEACNASFHNNAQVVKLILAISGCGIALTDAVKVMKTEGMESKVVDRAVDRGKLAVMFILASFV